MSDVAQATANLEAWLETMRAPAGYGGPVVHWWQNCLSFTGAGLDWRYEGIIHGYLTLWRRTGQQKWLQKACRAGDDLIRGQLSNGNFRHSCFELNPYAGGTPHEAAADLGLLQLAIALRQAQDARWQQYGETAEKNLRCYYLKRLWDDSARSFRDQPHIPSLVPNKVCTLVEALFAWAELRETVEPIERYVLPALQTVVDLQVTTAGPLVGAIPQMRQQEHVVAAYFPYYIARCIPALLRAYTYTEKQRWLDAAVAAFGFVARQVDEQGVLPQVVYENGSNRYPQWVAPLGDVLRTAVLLEPYGVTFARAAMQAALLQGQQPGGGIITGRGFEAQIGQQLDPDLRRDFRDCMAVTGWCDKAFRYLATQVPEDQPLPEPRLSNLVTPCRVRGQEGIWQETESTIVLTIKERAVYQWHKGQPWATIAAPEVMWK